MALAAATTWECRTTGLDTNSGGFVTGASGTDYSQQTSPQYSVTDGVTAGTTTITSATASFGTDVVGNLIYVQGGTGSLTAVWRQITARTNATTITVDAATGLGVSTGVTLHIGGCMLSPAMVSASMVTTNRVFQKAGTYSITTASTNVAAGCVSVSVGAIIWEGYSASRGDLLGTVLLQASGISGASLFTTTSGADQLIRNIQVDAAGLGTMKGFNLTRGTAYLCKALNCTLGGFAPSSTSCVLIRCAATGCSTTAAFTGQGDCYVCDAYSNTITGFSPGAANCTYVFCKSYSNTGATTEGFQTSQSAIMFIGCTAYSNGQDGFGSTGVGSVYINCVSESNVRYGFNVSGNAPTFQNCATFGNGTAATNITSTTSNQYGFITGSSSFFTNAAGGDFSLNSTTGAGALLRGLGYPGVFPDGTTTGYIDVGSAQHRDAGGLLLNPSLEGT